MIAGWLQAPHVRRWWGEPGEQAALIAEDLDNPQMAQVIAAYDGRPFAYLQSCDCHAWPAPHLADQPPGTRAIDAFIGDPAHLGQGHGAGMIAAYAAQLLAQGAPCVVIDSDPSNERAVRAWRRAGFSGTRVARDADGAAALILTLSA